MKAFDIGDSFEVTERIDMEKFYGIMTGISNCPWGNGEFVHMMSENGRESVTVHISNIFSVNDVNVTDVHVRANCLYFKEVLQ